MSRTATPRDLIPEAHCVLGTMLRPFSLGHHLLFERIESPFVGDREGDVVASPDQLALAVFICAAPYSQTLDAILRGDWVSEHARWIKSLKPRWYQRSRFIHETESQKFSAYLKDGYRRAPVMRHAIANGVEFTAPWECLMLARLMAGGFSFIEALETYLPAAWYQYHTLGEIKQAENLADITKWRRTFYTAEFAASFKAASVATAAAAPIANSPSPPASP